MLNKILSSPGLRALGSAVAGFIGYGAWAWLANMNHGGEMALRAALTQGTYSFVITLILTGLMEWLFSRLIGWPKRRRFLGSTIPVCLLLYLSSYSVNYLAGTPNILLTILPGAILSTLYAFSYIGALAKIEKKIDE
ncbi:MAG: hypothetical protein AB8B48_14435 [Pseudomonadales bacterium]